jgi:hypothetical protein
MQLTRKIEGPKFEKVAAKFLLSENPTTYASELLAHLYKQHPYLGQHQVNLSIEGQDDSLGYMYGIFTVKAADEAAAAAPVMGMTSGMAPQSAKPTLRIPVVVDNKKVHSFDVFITPEGAFMPLSETRVAAALFEASPYGKAPFSEQKLVADDQKQDYRTDAGPGTEMGRAFYMSKMSSVLPSVLKKLASHIDRDAAQAYLDKLSQDHALVSAIKLNPQFADAILELDQASMQKTASAEDLDVDVDVAVYSKAPGGYDVLCGSFDGSTHHVKLSNAQAEQLPVDFRQAVVEHGVAMVVSRQHAPLEPVEKTASLRDVEETGIYSVMNKAGSAQRAVVIREVMRLNGDDATSLLVIGPAGTSLQEKVAGVRCGDLDVSAIKGSEPYGEGVFVTPKGVIEPVKIASTITQRGEVTYLYEHPFYGKGQLKLANVKRPVHISGSDFLFPKDAKFVPTNPGLGYAHDTTTVDKVASRRDLINKVQLLSDGSEFTFRGSPLGDHKIENVKEAQALLTLGLLGDSPVSALDKIAKAKKSGEVTFVASRQYGKADKVKKAAAQPIDVSNIRVDLTKEAAALSGSDTVDSVLSLNFINPENIQGYIDCLPDYETAVRKLAELLIGVRLGLSDVPESAVSSALQGMERAIIGLKKLQIRVGLESRA